MLLGELSNAVSGLDGIACGGMGPFSRSHQLLHEHLLLIEQ